ncbi:hypothetical protein FSARC_9160 [Fusarium sarcochroum]|uniref:Uncharacterized protein n=1 Tax=Fusarium sarcochroum TaxID=1208366 RepID=A0A8H4TRJ9_9HYPO|nr:hypothetical protein FSARC_9160 [Fusarium sarcochroum]
MSPATLKYISSEPYRRYLNGGIRPNAELPPLDFNQDSKFNTPSSMRAHYKEVHKMSVLGRRPGNLNYEEDQQVLEWYTELVNGQMPSWPPVHDGVAPENNVDDSAQAGGETIHQVADEQTIQSSDGPEQGQSLPCAETGSVQPGDLSNHDRLDISKEAIEGEQGVSKLHAELDEMI